jgi:HSP20 family protein
MLLSTFDPFLSEFDRLVRNTFGSWPALPEAVRLDAIRHEGELEFKFDLPGIDPESIDVTVDKGMLTVSASRNEQYGEGQQPFIRERWQGTFTRRVYLPDTIDGDKVKASYSDGVLTVHAPLYEQAKPRKVAISTNTKAISA